MKKLFKFYTCYINYFKGTFRESCIEVLSTLRSNNDILLSILDSFVSDPLVDWSAQEQSNPFELSLALVFAVYDTDNRSRFLSLVDDCEGKI